MSTSKIRKLLVVAGMFSLLIVAAPNFAWAATEHVVTVKLEFSDAPSSTCSYSTVVISAASCDGADIDDELTAEATTEGINLFCGFSVNNLWECFYPVPSGCVQDDIEVSVQVGSSCTGTQVSGTAFAQSGSFGIFTFDIN